MKTTIGKSQSLLIGLALTAVGPACVNEAEIAKTPDGTGASAGAGGTGGLFGTGGTPGTGGAPGTGGTAGLGTGGTAGSGTGGTAGTGTGGAAGGGTGGAAGTGTGGAAGTGGFAGAGASSACSPCRAMNVDECFADLSCEAIPYWGESDEMCDVDPRGFATNCPSNGCREAGMVNTCPTLQDLIDTCFPYCSYNSFAIDARGCRACPCGPMPPGPVAACATDTLCGSDPTAEACAPSDCNALSDAIAAATSTLGSCTAVVRVDYQSHAIIGHQFVCGPYGPVDEASAGAAVHAATGHTPGPLLNGPNPEDVYLFSALAVDVTMASAVSARTGRVVFDGDVVAAGQGSPGQIQLPSPWFHPGELGHDCTPMPYYPQLARGFDLETVGNTLSQAEVDAVAGVVWDTALPEGLLKWGYIFDVVVLRYPKTVAPFEPTQAEYVVLLNSGWLE